MPVRLSKLHARVDQLDVRELAILEVDPAAVISNWDRDSRIYRPDLKRIVMFS